jgi:hypothetical protein
MRVSSEGQVCLSLEVDATQYAYEVLAAVSCSSCVRSSTKHRQIVSSEEEAIQGPSDCSTSLTRSVKLSISRLMTGIMDRWIEVSANMSRSDCKEIHSLALITMAVVAFVLWLA